MQDKEKNNLRKKVRLLPKEPGIYRFVDESGKIIYVGKAKNLRQRVSSYFLANPDRMRKQVIFMIKKIADVEYLITSSESDALLLENNLIKKYQPRYNMLLKDDKSYPWICVMNEEFPRISFTREKKNDGSKYFGPYTSVSTAKILIDLIEHIYPIRTCNQTLTRKKIAKKNLRVCLEYHIKKCMAPCTELQTEEEYMKFIGLAIKILKGNIGEVRKLLTAKMKKAAENLQIKEVQSYKDKLQRLENYQSKSVIVHPSMSNVDVFSLIYEEDEGVAYSNFLRIVDGAVVQTYTMEMKLEIEEEKEALLSMVIAEINQRLGGLSREIIVPFKPDVELKRKIYTVPKKGDKLTLLKLSEKNAKAYRIMQLNHQKIDDSENLTDKILKKMKSDLHLKSLPKRIECFDNSNLQGSSPVAACAVFINAKPAKNEYRHFNIKTVEGPDDFASMREVVFRRYNRMLIEKASLPQLIVIDGGKGQLNAALQSLKQLKLENKIAVLGLAKRFEEIYFPNDSAPLRLDKDSSTLKILMQIRDEAHRFGITFHRKKRSANFIRSELRDIKGIGANTANKLLAEFKTVSAVKEASMDELSATIGKRLAGVIFRHFNKPE
jgi:excinuclease ABC subunit C